MHLIISKDIHFAGKEKHKYIIKQNNLSNRQNAYGCWLKKVN